MRFEIGKGGAFFMVVGLLGLSVAVFVLGMIAGENLAQQNQPDSSLVASEFPVASPPAAPPTTSAQMQQASVASPATAPAANTAPAAQSSSPAAEPASSVATAPPPPPPAPAPRVIARPAVNALPERAAAPTKPAAPAEIARTRPPTVSRPATEDTGDTGADTGDSAAHAFNIQIEAVMDKGGADAMVQRLQALGFPASENEATYSGQTWYRVRVGPYASEEEAKQAEQRLHEQYRQRYAR